MHDHVNSHFVKTTAASCSFYPPSGFSTVHPYPRSLRDIQRQLSDRFLLFRLLKPNGTYECVFILLAIRRNRYISSLGEEKFFFLPPFPSAERSAFRGSLFKLSYQTRPSNCGDLSRPLGRLPRFFVDIYVAAVHRSLLRPNHRTICNEEAFAKRATIYP